MAIETVTGPYDPTLGMRVMLDVALISTFPDIFTLLEMLMGPLGLRTSAKFKLLGQSQPDEPSTSFDASKMKFIRDSLGSAGGCLNRRLHVLKSTFPKGTEMQMYMSSEKVYR